MWIRKAPRRPTITASIESPDDISKRLAIVWGGTVVYKTVAMRETKMKEMKVSNSEIIEEERSTSQFTEGNDYVLPSENRTSFYR
jgi:hypothetical protein